MSGLRAQLTQAQEQAEQARAEQARAEQAAPAAAPRPLRIVAIGGGTAAYTDACPKTGMMISEQKGDSPYFTIYKTGRPLVAPAR